MMAIRYADDAVMAFKTKAAGRVGSGPRISASIARRLAISQRNVAARRAQTATRVMSGTLDERAVVGCVDVVPAGTHCRSRVRAQRVGRKPRFPRTGERCSGMSCSQLRSMR